MAEMRMKAEKDNGTPVPGDGRHLAEHQAEIPQS